MDFAYGMLEDTKEENRTACNRKESNFRPIIEIVDKHAKDNLDTPFDGLQEMVESMQIAKV